MNKNLKRLALILIVVLPVLFLTACDDAGWAILEGAVEAWASKNDIYVDGNFKPAGAVNKIVQNKVGEITNTDTSIQFDGLDVIRDIEQADNLAADAMETLDTEKMADALSIRPQDWRLQEQSAVLWLAKDNGAAAQSAFEESDTLVNTALDANDPPFANCLPMRRTQLEIRLDALWQAVKTYESQPGRKQGDATTLRAEHKLVGEQLFEINTYQESTFCP